MVTNKICGELLQLGVQKSKFDPALFYWYNNDVLEGVLGGHVDDFFWVGTDAFEKQVIEVICSKFKISTTARDNFPFLGLQLKQLVDGSVVVEQYAYTEDLKLLQIKDAENKERTLNSEEQSGLETVIGQLSWIAHQTPE